MQTNQIVLTNYPKLMFNRPRVGCQRSFALNRRQASWVFPTRRLKKTSALSGLSELFVRPVPSTPNRSFPKAPAVSRPPDDCRSARRQGARPAAEIHRPNRTAATVRTGWRKSCSPLETAAEASRSATGPRRLDGPRPQPWHNLCSIFSVKPFYQQKNISLKGDAP